MRHILRGKKPMQWLLFCIILLQPIFDIITNWLLIANHVNFISYFRAALLVLFGVSVIIYCGKKRIHTIISLCWAGYVAAQYLLAQSLLPGTGMSEAENAFRVMVLPMFILWLVWLINEDTEATLDTIWKSALLSLLIIGVSSLLALITDSYTRTYVYQITTASAVVKIGFSGWSYSANAQSIILVTLFGLLCAPVIRSRKLWLLPVYGITFLLLMYFSGTRTAYYGMLIIPLAVLVILFFRQMIFKAEQYKWAVYAVFAAFLVLAVVLKPYSIMTTVDASRQDVINKVAEFSTPQPAGQPAPAPSAVVAVTPAAAGNVALPSPVPASQPASGSSITAPKWDTVFSNSVSWFVFNPDERARIYALRSAAHYNSGRIDDSVYEYLSKRSKLSSLQLADVRGKQTSFIMAFMHHADPLRLLTGFGKTWFVDVLMSVESDYAAIYGYYGIVGCILLFGSILYVLILSVKRLDFSKVKNFFTLEIVMSGLSVLLLLFLAKYSGRVFQQASVSFYLAISLALLYGSVTAQREEMETDN